MGCTQSQPQFAVTRTRKSSMDGSSHDDKIKKIYDYMTTEHEMSEQCVRNVAERMKQVMLEELNDTSRRLQERIESIKTGNPLDIFMVNVSDDEGNITYERFYRKMKEVHTEDCNILLDRLKRIKLGSAYSQKSKPDISKSYR